MDAISIYQDVSFRINKSQNGDLTYSQFNTISWLAQLSLIDWLTGSFTGNQPPELYLTQKTRDWVSFLITPYSAQVVGGKIMRPDDYYQFENLSRISGEVAEDCDDETEDKPKEVSNPVITLLSNDKFNKRCETYIKSLKPSFKKAIAKQVGLEFEFAPKDLGSVKLEYIRYPKKAEIKIKMDPVYNEEVPDPATTINFEWGEYARNLLIWFMCDEFSNHNREQALKTFNTATGKTARP